MLVGMLAAAAVVACPAAAAAPGRATRVTFSRWRIIVVGHGAKIGHTIRAGGSFDHCASRRLTQLTVWFTATGPSFGPDHELWYLNGHLRDSFYDSELYSSGSFTIQPGNGESAIPVGKWSLVITYGGKTVGRSTVTVGVNRSC